MHWPPSVAEALSVTVWAEVPPRRGGLWVEKGHIHGSRAQMQFPTYSVSKSVAVELAINSAPLKIGNMCG
jgi:hypothetical protein